MKFEDVWKLKEAEGYQYNGSALENVRFGFELALKHALQPVEAKGVLWNPMVAAPKDGTWLRLLVRFEDHGMEDTLEPHVTIGSNSFEHTAENEWIFLGWNWEQDCFEKGIGEPIGWLPLI